MDIHARPRKRLHAAEGPDESNSDNVSLRSPSLHDAVAARGGCEALGSSLKVVSPVNWLSNLGEARRFGNQQELTAAAALPSSTSS